jgi:glucose/mannose-6-phosphate isomerase
MSRTDLDEAAIYEQLDPQGLLARIAALPAQIAEAWSAARALDLPASYRDAREIVVLGMGGSGIGGLLLERLAIDLDAPTRVRVVRGYRLPADVGSQALVFASSNSGDTEEIVASFGEALKRSAMCIAATAGGQIASMARDAAVPHLVVRWQDEPRAALGWSFASLLAICGKLGLLRDLDGEIGATLDEMRAMGAACASHVAEASNPAKQLARRLEGRLAVFIGAEALAPVAYRWRTQVNENAKSWAIADELPEMNHNAQTGYGLPRRAVPLLHAVLLRHGSVHPRTALRFDATADEMRRSGVSAEIVEVSGPTLLAQVLRAVQLGDYVSYYLGLLNGVEPSPVPALGRLKDLLASKD